MALLTAPVLESSCHGLPISTLFGSVCSRPWGVCLEVGGVRGSARPAGERAACDFRAVNCLGWWHVIFLYAGPPSHPFPQGNVETTTLQVYPRF
jgi:hypothetical protein